MERRIALKKVHMNLKRLVGLFFVTYCFILFGFFLAGVVVAYIEIAPEQSHLGVIGRICLDVGGGILKGSLIWLGGLDGAVNFIPTSGTIVGTAALRFPLAHAIIHAVVFAVVVNFAVNRQFTFGAAMVMPVLVAGLTYSLLEARLTSVGGVTPGKFGIVFTAQYLGLLVGNVLRIFFRGHAD